MGEDLQKHLYNPNVMMDLFILNRYKTLPSSQGLDNLYPEQKWFLIAAESLLGDMSSITNRAQASLRLQMLESLKDPLEILPKGMASSISRAGIDPVQEGLNKIELQKKALEKQLRGDD